MNIRKVACLRCRLTAQPPAPQDIVVYSFMKHIYYRELENGRVSPIYAFGGEQRHQAAGRGPVPGG